MQDFKASVPRKKKQALRSKIKAIGERDNKKKKISNECPNLYCSYKKEKFFVHEYGNVQLYSCAEQHHSTE
jgi:hypothetical protein